MDNYNEVRSVIEDFLKELTELSKKYGLVIEGDSPHHGVNIRSCIDDGCYTYNNASWNMCLEYGISFDWEVVYE